MSYIYINTLAWILKCLKLYPSISLIDDSAAATQPLSRCARVADAATQPPGAATQPLSHIGPMQPLSHSAGVAGGAATQLLCQPLSHSARVAGAATQPLSHSARVQPLSHHSARVAGAATQPLSHSEWLSG